MLTWMKAIDWQRLRRSGVGFVWLVAVGGMVAAWAMGVPRLQAFASQHRTATHVSVEFRNAPPWFKDELAAQLTRTAEMQLHSGDPLRRDELLAVRQVLLDSHWFDAIYQVRRVRPDLVEIEGQFVRPYAIVRDGRGDHLVDAQGKLLPKSYPSGSSTPFMSISGVRFARPAIGSPWEGADVAAGLRLLRLIDRQPWRNQVKDVDVAAYLNDGPIRLRTNIGSSIVWGGAPGEEPALEVLADDKLRRLHFLYEKHQRIDGGHRGEIDITDQRAVVTRQPVSADADSSTPGHG